MTCRYKTMKNKRNLVIRGMIGIAAGGALGLAYYGLVGCETGGCIITSSPVTAGLYGALIGVFAAAG